MIGPDDTHDTAELQTRIAAMIANVAQGVGISDLTVAIVACDLTAHVIHAPRRGKAFTVTAPSMAEALALVHSEVRAQAEAAIRAVREEN